MILFLTFSNVTGNVLMIVSGILVARWLLPSELGLFNSFNIVVGYIVLAQIGIPSGLSRELPYFIGKGQKETAHQMASVAKMWQLMLGLIILAVSIIVAIVLLYRGNTEFAAGAAVIGVLSFQGFYITKYLKVLFRTNQDFNKLARIKLIIALVSFLSIWFVFRYDFYGLCLRAVIIAVADLLITSLWNPIKVKALWDINRFRELMKTGLPMYIVANVYSLWPVIQKTIILSIGGTASLGLFAIAVIVENGIKVFSTSINNVVYPAMATRWGEGATIGDLVRQALNPVLIAGALFLVAIPLCWILLPPAIEFFLPNYIEGIRAAQWMLPVGGIQIFLSFSLIYNVIQKQRDRLLSYLAGISVWGIFLGIAIPLLGFSLDLFPKAMLAGLIVMLAVNTIHIMTYRSKIFSEKTHDKLDD